MPDARWLDNLPRYVFFTGKGGVGKTSLACATAVSLADAGQRVLLVSTDPASNVGQVFGLAIGDTITAIPDVPGLDALEIDPEQAAEAYRERIIGPVRDLLPAREIASIAEQLSGSCTTEIASFNEFTGFLADDALTARYDHVVFDTAPTGHTIRLLQLPGDWTSFLDEGKGDASCLGPMAGLDRTRSMYAAALHRLADPTVTRMVLVARPQVSALREAARTAAELAALGITDQWLVVNGVMPADAATEAATDIHSTHGTRDTHEGQDAVRDDGPDPLVAAVRARERAALADLPAALDHLPIAEVPLHAETMVGVAALRHLLAPSDSSGETSPADAAAGAPSTGKTSGPTNGPPAAALDPSIPVGLSQLVDQLAEAGHGLVMCMGKGGVGKTTVAAALAVSLASRGLEVHLTTTDPAAHLHETLAGEVDGLTVSRIDPHAATAAYRERVMTTKGAALDEAGRARLAEDLQSPCTEEVAVFQQFSRLVHESRRHIVIMDTAPTGHTLLLMDATGSYHRDVVRTMGEGTSYTTPLMRLQDPAQTRVIIVTLPDTTPVLEAEGLADDLRRASIEPWAWVVNASVAAAHPRSRFLARRAAAELPHIERVCRGAHPDRVALIPLLAADPVGADALRALAAPDLSTALPSRKESPMTSPNGLPGAPAPSTKPSVLFVCVHNAGRSQMGAAYTHHLSGGAVEVRSAGSAPAETINPAVREAMLEEGIDISAEKPKILTTEAVQASDVVITMGCGDTCPYFPGKRYLDWVLADPAGQGVESVRPIRDEIKGRVLGLLAELGVESVALPRA